MCVGVHTQTDRQSEKAGHRDRKGKETQVRAHNTCYRTLPLGP